MGFEIRDGVLLKYSEEPGVTEVTIPDSVTEISSWAFKDCTNLTSVTLGKGVSIAKSAFNGIADNAIILTSDGSLDFNYYDDAYFFDDDNGFDDDFDEDEDFDDNDAD